MELAAIRLGGEDGLEVVYDSNLEIGALDSKPLKLRLGVSSLPDSFRDGSVHFEVHDRKNHSLRREFKLTVVAPPRLEVTPSRINFGQIPHDRVALRSIRVSNQGGSPARLLSLSVFGSPAMHIKDGPTLPIPLAPNKHLEFKLQVDPKAEAPKVDHRAEVVLAWKDLPETRLEAEAEVVMRAVKCLPEQVKLAGMPVGRRLRIPLEVRNQGNQSLEIVAVEGDQNWLQVPNARGGITLLAAEDRKREVEAPGVYPESAHLDLTLDLRGQKPGDLKGSVKVLSTDLEPLRVLPVQLTTQEPEPFPGYVGIDFGTSNSVIAFFDRGQGRARVIRVSLPEGYEDASREPDHRLIPSVLAFREGHDDFLVGHEAVKEMSKAPEYSVRSIKRIMGYQNKRSFYGREYSVTELASMMINRLVELAEFEQYRQKGRYYAINSAIVTVPANFYELQIASILEACGLAGLDTEGKHLAGAGGGIILDEPTAAAIFHATLFDSGSHFRRKLDQGQAVHLLIYDHGGGTLDVSVLRVEPRPKQSWGLMVLANQGDNLLGGDTMDLALMGHVLERCQEEYPQFHGDLIGGDINHLQEQKSLHRWPAVVWSRILDARMNWKNLCEAAKWELSRQEEAEVVIGAKGLIYLKGSVVDSIRNTFRITISRQEFEKVIADLLVGVDELVKGALAEASLQAEQIDYLIHTGRSSLMPAIRQRMSDLFGHLPEDQDVLNEEHLKVCVAKGAAIFGAIKNELGAVGRIEILKEGKTLPHAYGVSKLVGPASWEFDPIIPKGTAYPCEGSKLYSQEFIRDNPRLHLDCYQNSGQDNRISPDNRALQRIGEYTLDLADLAERSVEVKFVVDANRLLSVFANSQQIPIRSSPMAEPFRWVW